MQGLLASTVLVVEAAGGLKVLLLLAIASFAVYRRPRRPPAQLLLASEASCLAPSVAPGPLRLGPRTRYGRGWVRLVDRSGRLDVLLLEDQVEAEEWSRLSALLRRMALD